MQGPPVHAKTFVAADYAATQILLNNTSGAPKHAACALFVNATSTKTLIFKDGAGVTNTITFAAAFVGTIRGTFLTLESGMTAESVTAFYMSDPG